MDHKFIGGFIKSSSGFQSSHVRPMAQLSLGITPVDLLAPSERKPIFDLIIVTEVLQTLAEHGVVERIWLLPLHHQGVVILGVENEVVVKPFVVDLVETLETFVDAVHLLFSRHIEPFRGVPQQRISFNHSLELVDSRSHLRAS
jgi:hypothetical protein